MKYEPLSGNQDLFTGARENTVAICKISENLTLEFHKCEELLTFLQQKPLCDRPDIAMRRIVPEPKRWTVADQKAGKFPDVGCKVFDKINENEVIVKAINSRQVCLESNDGFIYLLPPNDIDPIEAPEEKAARLREEWCSNALGSASILSGMKEYDLKRLGGYIGNIYDALISGDLPVPIKGSDEYTQHRKVRCNRYN